MVKDDSKLRVRRWRERQRARKTAATVTKTVTQGNGVTGNDGNGNGNLFTGSPGEPAVNDRFAEFWREYPRKVAKLAAEREWKRAAVSDVRAEEILYGLRAHLPSLLAAELRYRPHASTWLHQQRWADPVEKAEVRETAAERRRREWADD